MPFTYIASHLVAVERHLTISSRHGVAPPPESESKEVCPVTDRSVKSPRRSLSFVYRNPASLTKSGLTRCGDKIRKKSRGENSIIRRRGNTTFLFNAVVDRFLANLRQRSAPWILGVAESDTRRTGQFPSTYLQPYFHEIRRQAAREP